MTALPQQNDTCVDKGNKRKYNMWSAAETNKFLHGLALHQKNFVKIAEYIGTKDYSQVCFIC